MELRRPDDTALLRRLLLEPGHTPNPTTLKGESQPKLVANLEAYRALLKHADLGLLKELALFVLLRVTLTVTLASSLSTSLE